MAQYVITGVAGFIGAAVAKALLADGHEVLGIDDLRPTYDVRLKRHRLADLDPVWGDSGFDMSSNGRGLILHRKPMQAINLHDLLEPTGGEPFEAVIHLAANAGVRQSVESPIPYITENIEGMRIALEWVRQGAAKRLVYASSSSVYTPKHEWPMEVGDDDDEPRTPYAASKRMTELMASAYYQSYGVQSVGLRFFSVYGPAGRPDSRASVFQYVRQVIEREPITIYGSLRQSRDFTHIRDAVAMVLRVHHGDRLPGAQVLNGGLGNPRLVTDLIAWIGDITGEEPVFSVQHDARSDTAMTWAKCESAFERLRAGQVPLAEGLHECVDWYKANREWAKEIKP